MPESKVILKNICWQTETPSCSPLYLLDKLSQAYAVVATLSCRAGSLWQPSDDLKWETALLLAAGDLSYPVSMVTRLWKPSKSNYIKQQDLKSLPCIHWFNICSYKKWLVILKPISWEGGSFPLLETKIKLWAYKVTEVHMLFLVQVFPCIA